MQRKLSAIIIVIMLSMSLLLAGCVSQSELNGGDALAHDVFEEYEESETENQEQPAERASLMPLILSDINALESFIKVMRTEGIAGFYCEIVRRLVYPKTSGALTR